jgi:prepilin-type N-terminal cleavage/methylation domain-containing protein
MVSKRSTRAPASQAGFTLVEMMVVVIIISILAAMGIANYIRMSNHAKEASCVSNQRNIHQAATIYASDNVVGDGDMDVEDLRAAGAVALNLCECPTSNDATYDDYTLTWLNGLPRDVSCDIKGDEHLWTPH